MGRWNYDIFSRHNYHMIEITTPVQNILVTTDVQNVSTETSETVVSVETVKEVVEVINHDIIYVDVSSLTAELDAYIHEFVNTNNIVITQNQHEKSKVKGVGILDETNTLMAGNVSISPTTQTVQCSFNVPLSGRLIIY